MSIITTIIVGLIVGALAKLIMPGKDPGGIIITIALGIAGALLARLIGRAVGWYEAGQTPGIITSIIGALILLAIYRLIIQKRRPGEVFRRGHHDTR
ncbi:MAG: GlsB/YeaQ/YmgE family stress response membrane protein [Kofleriaceae bacterium]|nr:GlsB/YeaQ/YmgE family stress response membrane protein [Kofleriaceae bacterium]